MLASTDWANHEGNRPGPRQHPPRSVDDYRRPPSSGHHQPPGREVHGSLMLASTDWANHEGNRPGPRLHPPRSVEDYRRPPSSGHHQPPVGLPPPQPHQRKHSTFGGEVHGSHMLVLRDWANQMGPPPPQPLKGPHSPDVGEVYPAKHVGNTPYDGANALPSEDNEGVTVPPSPILEAPTKTKTRFLEAVY
jgi:hypothetical protein